MSSELESLKQRITELEAKNDKLEAENAELRKENTEIHDLRIKLSISDAEIAQLKRMNAETLRANKEYNERRDAKEKELEQKNAELEAKIKEMESEFRDRITKVEQKQVLNEPRGTNSSNDITPNNNSSNFNSGVVHHEKPLEEKEMNSFLLEAHKKIVSSEIKQRNKERQADRKKLHTESMTSSGQEVAKQSGQNSHKKKGTENIVQVIIDGIQDDIKRQEPTSSGSSSEVLQVTEISATARRPKCSSSLFDLAHLFDKASDAEYRTKKANEEEILCWVNFGKEFIYQYNSMVENSNGEIGEKKAKGIIYDGLLKQTATIREKRSKEMGIQLPKISRSSLTRRTQRSMKLVRIFEKIGMDKIKYLSEYSPNSISELTNDQIQEIIEAQKERDNSAKQDDFPTPEISADEKDYLKMITGDIDDETAYWGTPYENEAKVEKEEVNEVKESSKVQSDDDVYFDEEVDHDSAPHPVGETNDDSDCSHDNDSEEEMPDDSDDDGYNGYNRYGEYDEWGNRDRGYYSYSDGSRERKTSPMMSPIISPVTA